MGMKNYAPQGLNMHFILTNEGKFCGSHDKGRVGHILTDLQRTWKLPREGLGGMIVFFRVSAEDSYLT